MSSNTAFTELQSLLQEQKSRLEEANAAPTRIDIAKALSADITKQNTANIAALEQEASARVNIEESHQELVALMEQVRNRTCMLNKTQLEQCLEILRKQADSVRPDRDIKELESLFNNPTPAAVNQIFNVLQHEAGENFLEEIGDVLFCIRNEMNDAVDANVAAAEESEALHNSAYEDFESERENWIADCKINEENRANLKNQVADLQQQLNDAEKSETECALACKDMKARYIEIQKTPEAFDNEQVNLINSQAEALIARHRACVTKVEACTSTLGLVTKQLDELKDAPEPTFDADAWPIVAIDKDLAKRRDQIVGLVGLLETMGVQTEQIDNSVADANHICATARIVNMIGVVCKAGVWDKLDVARKRTASLFLEEFFERMTSCRKVTAENFAEITSNFRRHVSVDLGSNYFGGDLGAVMESGNVATQKTYSVWNQLRNLSNEKSRREVCDVFDQI